MVGGMAPTSRPHRDVRVVLAHGASGDAASMRPHVDGLRDRGIDAHAIDLPKRKAEDAVPAYVAALAALPPMPAGRRSRRRRPLLRRAGGLAPRRGRQCAHRCRIW